MLASSYTNKQFLLRCVFRYISMDLVENNIHLKNKNKIIIAYSIYFVWLKTTKKTTFPLNERIYSLMCFDAESRVFQN